MNKQDLRKHMKLLLASIPSSVRLKNSELLLQLVLAHEFYKTAKGVSIYVSFSTEPDTSTLIRDALRRGKVVVVPQIITETQGRGYELSTRLGLMRMRRLHDADQLLSWPLNKFGVREPPQPSDGVDQDDALTHFVDLFVVPGLAFTMKGERLGRGKGFYDQYLAGLRKFYLETQPNRLLPRTIALAFSEQIVDRICTGQHDVVIDAIIST
ncbi:5 formyltetrahydrofolate cyclo ligase [Echinococcus multilocularis]|uniref:5-formyltetrahydrofolate cyclo-ligase n=1 Tax=Echinococcus multilocularis TaxID=6211 RepID=A0A068YA73_ECHMU|nr:5 formyltetrahydrofolate cyclo ligase [Echinococcus multilocularis]